MIENLQTQFADIMYHDGSHTYTCKGEPLMSITKFLSSLKGKFHQEFWSTLKAYEFSGYKVKSIWNQYDKFLIATADYDPICFDDTIYLGDDHSHLKVTPEMVKDQWAIDSLVGTTRGTFIHNYLEKLEARVTDEPNIEIPSILNTGQGVNYYNSLVNAKVLCKDFVEWARTNLILVAAEFSVGDPKLGLAGRFDRLYLNRQSGKYEIWDFKTDKQIRYKSGFGKLRLFNLPDCEFEKYSLQTSFYRKIIEDALNVKLGESKIVWFNLKDNKWEIIQTKDYTSLITSTYENNRATYQQLARADETVQ